MPIVVGDAVIKGCDTTDYTLTGATLAANGYGFVCRYFSNHVANDWKDIHAAEVAEKSAAGVRIVSNWELMANPVNDRATGRAVARDFLAEQDALPGHVDWNPCYYSLDTRSSTAGAWDEYAKGWADVLTPERCGAYAEGLVLKHLLDLGVIKWTWLSMSTSFPGASGYTLNIKQTGSGHIAGHSVDFDTALTANYGGWLQGEADPMAFTTDDAKTLVTADVVPNFPWAADAKTNPTIPLTTAILTAGNLAHAARGDIATLVGKVADLATAVAAIPTTTVPAAPIDLDALAVKVADLLAARLQS